MIDRLAPTQRPEEPIRGYQKWRSLLFMHWAAPVDAVRKLVPANLELDLHQDVAYVGLVPFAMEGVRHHWFPKSCAFKFLETNVRVYVHHRGRPGVYFLSLDAASRLAVRAARWGWGLPYYDARMSSRRSGDELAYESTRAADGARLLARFRIGEALGASQPDSLEHFLLERYLLFVEHRGRLWEGQVHHTPYPAHRAEVVELHDELVAASGLPAVGNPPRHAHYSPGVDVEVFALRNVDAASR